MTLGDSEPTIWSPKWLRGHLNCSVTTYSNILYPNLVYSELEYAPYSNHGGTRGPYDSGRLECRQKTLSRCSRNGRESTLVQRENFRPGFHMIGHMTPARTHWGRHGSPKPGHNRRRKTGFSDVLKKERLVLIVHYIGISTYST